MSKPSLELVTEEGLEEFTLPCDIGSTRSLFQSDSGAEPRLRLQLFKRTKDNSVVGQVWFGPKAGGPPGHAHGGATAYVMDEVMGAAAWLNKRPCVAAELSINYRKMLPLQENMRVEAWVVKKESKKIYVESHIKNSKDQVIVTASATLVSISKDKMSDLLGDSQFSIDDFEFAE